MRRALLGFAMFGIVAITMLLAATSSAAEWEGALPEGAEKDLVALNRAMGNLDGVDHVGAQTNARLKTEMELYHLEGLRPKAADFNGIFDVSAAVVPPEILAAKNFQVSFHLVKLGDTYYLLTPKNFARLFAPVTNEKEVLALVTAYEQICGTSLAQTIGPDYQWQLKKRTGDPTYPKKAPPARSSITKRKSGGFDVRLIVFTGVRYGEKRFLVHTDGTVEETQPFKDLSPPRFRGPIPE